jgi:two-component system, sensor histidine kinase and response regulator
MDVQMPIMGGYEATSQIRRTHSLEVLPVIGMTANVLHGAREECLAAGMNDYISKPIDSTALTRMILQWTKPSPESEASVPGTLPSDPSANPSVLDAEDGCRRLNGNATLYLRLLRAFLREYSPDAHPFDALTALRDFEAIRALAHAIRGVAGNLSADNIWRITGAIEQAASDRNQDEINRWIEVYSSAFDALRVQVNLLADTIIQQEQSAQHSHADASEEDTADRPLLDLVPKLKYLKGLILDSDLDALHIAEGLTRVLSKEGFDKEMELLNDCLLRLEFDHAIPLIDVLISHADRNSEKETSDHKNQSIPPT